MPCDDPVDIGVDGRDRGAEGERRYGRCGVRPHPRQGRQRRRIRGHRASVLGDDDPRRSPQGRGPAVVAEALPGPQNLRERGGGQRRRRREQRQEPQVGGHHPAHLRLLEHHLRDQDPVRVRVGAPGVRRPPWLVPGQEPRGPQLAGTGSTVLVQAGHFVAARGIGVRQ